MATAADNVRNTNDPAPAGKMKRKRQLLITGLAAALAAATAGGGVWYYSQSHALGPAAPSKPVTPPPALYLALEPAFVVNLPISLDGPRYLQVEVQLMTRDPLALEKLRSNIPAIRARLLMFFSQTDPEQIGDRVGMEALQTSALAEVKTLMQAETGTDAAEALLFTSFVTQ